jgi:hypothetical protein
MFELMVTDVVKRWKTRPVFEPLNLNEWEVSEIQVLKPAGQPTCTLCLQNVLVTA